jgi:NAD(P)-dependent dehydrogenase (short-subunit alcohol dehydrogenase family)
MSDHQPGALLADKVAVITGAGSGVGRATAQLFATYGAKVVCADIRKPWVDETVDLVVKDGGQAVAALCDVSVEADIENLIAEATRVYGRVDIMFNNAGVSFSGLSIEQHTDEHWDRLVNINLRGVFLGSKHAVLAFKKQGGGGVIVNTSSVAGLVGWGGVAYGATKAGVNQISRTLAVEVAPLGIRVNSICPGAMATNLGNMSQTFTEPDSATLELIGSVNPMGLSVRPSHIADAALFLASDLSAAVTGVALPVDGGFVAR